MSECNNGTHNKSCAEAKVPVTPDVSLDSDEQNSEPRANKTGGYVRPPSLRKSALAACGRPADGLDDISYETRSLDKEK
eukprot:CAMPEP_0113533464 /NCGR_PEP_ID=MMETSP0015_2-20120614/4621_1 /TAXON_ID=2838 /ORGANISM="Odontella" /LENGTH=78 /DNA_ID=CAMNT_0000432523 /DNA_START=802 /DNA_END=1038 /DNA_ORIENTATION=+ /assembly_acc=CAM_ASM_000160